MFMVPACTSLYGPWIQVLSTMFESVSTYPVRCANSSKIFRYFELFYSCCYMNDSLSMLWPDVNVLLMVLNDETIVKI